MCVCVCVCVCACVCVNGSIYHLSITAGYQATSYLSLSLSREIAIGMEFDVCFFSINCMVSDLSVS